MTVPTDQFFDVSAFETRLSATETEHGDAAALFEVGRKTDRGAVASDDLLVRRLLDGSGSA